MKSEARQHETYSVRVSPNSYYAAAFLVLFTSAFLLFIEQNAAAAVGLCLGLIVLPLLAFTDRLTFDGRKIRRTGMIPRFFGRSFGIRTGLRPSHIEKIETRALRAVRFSGRVVYVHRTTIRGRGMHVTFASRGERYARLVRELFSLVAEDVLDERSFELRDYLANRREIRDLAQVSKIPSVDALESSMEQVRSGRGLLRQSNAEGDAARPEKLEKLRLLANQLRVTGSLRQSAEAFRRASILGPADAWLLFEFAKCLSSLAGAERDQKLRRRSLAMLRLAEMRAGGDARLLSRLGERYYHLGQWDRAAVVFKRTKDAVGENYRSWRGLAELALREGKIAHVIHNFGEAERAAKTDSLRRWTGAEVEYFSRLNNDEEYMELEISRVNLVDKLAFWRQTCLRAAGLGFPLIIIGIVIQHSLTANFGWSISGISIAAWAVLSVLGRMLSERIPVDLVDRSD
jgi:tetratricopeptide (TPR) repeat protein